MLRGEIHSLVPEKGFGFIKSASGGADVFFHCSALNVLFDSIHQGQQVEYELDPHAEKPRALKVSVGDVAGPTTPTNRPGKGSGGRHLSSAGGRGTGQAGRPGQRRAGQGGRAVPVGRGQRGASRTVDTRRAADRTASDSGSNLESGFVTKLHHRKFRGFISSVKHGPEFLFVAQDVIGDKRYSQLQIGDFVQFVKGPADPDAPKQPIAKSVRAVERENNVPMVNKLRRHPNARKKKPTWR